MASPGGAGVSLRLRATGPGLLALPWLHPLATWDALEVPLRDLPVGPSRHLVRFVETDGVLWALKEMPERVAVREYEALRTLEHLALPAVRAVGVVVQPHHDAAILVTRYLARSWQYRRLLMRLAPEMSKHRQRLFDSMAALLVDLHRNGVFWGDCSLANTLFSRDGQTLQAWLVDAETSEIHATLSPGQREHDLLILTENVAGGMLDLATHLDWPVELHEQLLEESVSVRTRYQQLWDVLHDEPTIPFAERHRVGGQIDRLHRLGYGIDEVRLEASGDDDTFRLRVAVAARRYHATLLKDLLGLDVGQGQATILMGDLRSYQAKLELEAGSPVPDHVAAAAWEREVFGPGVRRAHAAMGGVGDPVQAYCDLLEVRWLLSEEAGDQVGDDSVLDALANQATPAESAARMAVADTPTLELRAVPLEARPPPLGAGPPPPPGARPSPPEAGPSPLGAGPPPPVDPGGRRAGAR